MPTTSLKLSDDLKQPAVSAAQQEGVSTHAFMINAIEQATIGVPCEFYCYCVRRPGDLVIRHHREAGYAVC